MHVKNIKTCNPTVTFLKYVTMLIFFSETCNIYIIEGVKCLLNASHVILVQNNFNLT